MNVFLKNIADWFTSQVTFIVTSFYVMGITPVILCSNGVIKGSKLVLAAYWVTLVTSLAIIALTLLRWLVKYPAKLTWLQGAFGIVSVNTLIHSYVTLSRFYSDEGGISDITVVLLAIVVIVLTLCAVKFTRKAMANNFKN